MRPLSVINGNASRGMTIQPTTTIPTAIRPATGCYDIV